MKILLLDNFDSFTYNLVHYLRNIGADVVVKRNNQEDLLTYEDFDAAVLSPGPCTPMESGLLMDFIKKFYGKKPMLGVCLGMQALGMHCHWELRKAHEPRHGKPSKINHSGKALFAGISNPMQVGRYHSLVVVPNNGLYALAIDAECDGEIMAVSDVNNRIYGVQFHPESILTPEGQRLIKNWLEMI